MPIVEQTDEFRGWFADLRDNRAQGRIASRLERLAFGLPGDCKPVGDGVLELRIDYGPGYRVYHVYMSADLITVLWGGDKGSQVRDIAKAKSLAKEMGK